MRKDPAERPRAWRVTGGQDGGPPNHVGFTTTPLFWSGLLLAVVLGIAVLFVTGAGNQLLADLTLGARPTATATPVSRPTRDVVISSIGGATPTPAARMAATQPAVVTSAPASAPPSSIAGFPAPPARVQDVTPQPVPSASGQAPAGPATTPVSTSAPRASVQPTQTSQPSLSSSIQSDLNAINATATALSQNLAPSASPTAGDQANSRPAPTDTPIPTAAPPVVPAPAAPR